jgi:hypothetical protein
MTMTTIQENDLCVAAFSTDALRGIRWVTGLVDVVAVSWSYRHSLLLFIVRSRDKTGVLFNRGTLNGKRIDEYVHKPQDMLIEWMAPGHIPFGSGGN